MLSGSEGLWDPLPVASARQSSPTYLTEDEFRWLVAFVRHGLQDRRATPENLRRSIPAQLPSRLPGHVFQ